MMIVSSAANAESFDEITTDLLSADNAVFSDLSVNNSFNILSNRSGMNIGIPLSGTSKFGNFIECIDHRIGAYNTMFYVSENGHVAATVLNLRQTSANHCCSPSLWIGYSENTEVGDLGKFSGFSFSTSSYPGGPGEKYYPMIFEANKFIYNKGDMIVNGKITCKNELNVTSLNANDVNVKMNNVADYVFDENYDLKSLSEVESYVKENKHLPGIPSAEEIEQNGVSLSKMSNMLLEKVEELTLHLIRLEKENAELKAKFESLEK